MTRVLSWSYARRELRSIWLQIESQKERNWYLEDAKGERRNACKVEGRMARRNKKDEGFKPEFQGVDKKKIEFSLVRSTLLRKMLKYVSMALISRMICIHDMLFTMLQLHLDAQMFSWFLLSSSCSCDFFVCSSK